MPEDYPMNRIKDIYVLRAKRFGIYQCDGNCSLKDAAKLLTERNISSLVVTNDAGELDGIITRTDLVRVCYRRDDWATQQVRDHMNEEVITVQLDDTLADVMEMLVDRHIHRVVAVREENGRIMPIGILSAADVVYHMAQD